MPGVHEQRETAESFGAEADRYDRARPSYPAELVSRLATTGLDVLDVGCGTGALAAEIRSALPRATIWGVDLVAGMLAGGRIRWQAIRDHALPVQGDSERLPFPDGAFDLVTCTNSFHHYPDQERAVAEMHRVLKPGRKRR